MDAAVLDAAAARLALAARVFVLTGAGLGVASGLPTFRGAGGLWNDRRVEQLASLDGFRRDPHTSWAWYNMRLAAYADAQPNAGHVALAELAALVPHLTLATQNVDGLHLRAGSRDVIELHGNLRTLTCTGCAAADPLHGPFDLADLHHGCGGLRRPGVVWFGEALPRAAWDAAFEASSRADAIIVAGTSAQVQPAASLARAGDPAVTVIEVNPEPALSGTGAFVLDVGTEAGLPALVERVRRARPPT
jgi:NAD-dependent deacetylase